MRALPVVSEGPILSIYTVLRTGIQEDADPADLRRRKLTRQR
jgi:hypothetical protein